MSLVNWAEALSKVAADGDDPQLVANSFQTTDRLLLQPLTGEDCVEITGSYCIRAEIAFLARTGLLFYEVLSSGRY